MTYAELKSNIASYLNRSDLTDVIDTFIDSTEAEFNRRLRVKGMIKRATATLATQYLAYKLMAVISHRYFNSLLSPWMCTESLMTT